MKKIQKIRSTCVYQIPLYYTVSCNYGTPSGISWNRGSITVLCQVRNYGSFVASVHILYSLHSHCIPGRGFSGTFPSQECYLSERASVNLESSETPLPSENQQLGEVLSVEVSCLCRLLIYTDNDFHLNLGFK